MANLKDVIYLSAEDYNTLYTNGTVTINGVTLTYDANNIYIVPDNTQQQIDDILALIPSSATSSNKLATASDIPSNNVTGSGTSGSLTKFNGTNTITDGPVLSSTISSQTQSTKFLREDGSWAAPSYTTDTNTTYTFATGDSNGQIKITPSSGTEYNVSVKGLGNDAYRSLIQQIGSQNTTFAHKFQDYTAYLIIAIYNSDIFVEILNVQGGTIDSANVVITEIVLHNSNNAFTTQKNKQGTFVVSHYSDTNNFPLFMVKIY